MAHLRCADQVHYSLYNGAGVLRFACKNFGALRENSPAPMPIPAALLPAAVGYIRRTRRLRATRGRNLQAQVTRLTRASNQRELYSLATGFTADPSSSGAVVALTDILQGDETTERVGRQVILKHLKARGIVTLNSSATDSRVRMMIIRDNIGNTTVPAITDMFTSVAQFAANKLSIETPQVRHRFTVLMDKYLLVNAGSGLTKTFTFSRKMNTRCYFTGPLTTDGGTNNLYLFIASNEATNDPVVNAAAEILWTNP